MQDRHTYDRVSVWLHWTTAVLIVALFATGWSWGFFERGSTGRMVLFRAHIAMGSAVLALAVFRVGWRLTHAAPPLPAGMNRPTVIAARATHGLLYLAILVQPALGLLAISSFGKTLGRWPRELHSSLTWLILAIVLMHAAAAAWHQFVRRDGLLSRMLPACLATLVLAGSVVCAPQASAEIAAGDIPIMRHASGAVDC